MATVFGIKDKAKLFVPKGSSSWQIGDLVKKGEYDNILLLSFSARDQEIIDVRRCFNETTHIFAFGRNPNGCILEVSLLVVLYNGCPKSKSKWGKIDDLRKKYSENRVYKKDEPLKITIDDLSLSGYLIQMSTGDVNPQTKTAVVNFMFILDQEV